MDSTGSIGTTIHSIRSTPITGILSFTGSIAITGTKVSYNTWYGPNYGAFAAYPGQFYRVGVFYPTVAFRDLAVGVSDWPVDRQVIFRRKMHDFTAQLEVRVSQRIGNTVVFDRNDIVVSHHQVIDNAAVVIHGFVNHGNAQMPFKALLDFTPTNQDSIFIPASNTDQPSDAEVQELQQMNDRIVSLGGVIEDPSQDQAPTTPTQPTPMNPVPTNPPTTSTYGGEAIIVFNPSTGAWATYHGPASRPDAETSALAECGSDCSSVNSAQLEAGGASVREHWSHNGWVALATNGKGFYGTGGVHDSEADAEQSALRNCNRGADNGCYVLRSLSSFDYQPDQDGVHPSN